ncbi:MAG: type I restriction enzyme HsdR N-terminal domain-containing protein [Flavobacteriaceae bacterium]|nr:type I restriction enzyme HsdR N-terminal domain-containing protein [Flavobacteriaceae bacterium]MDG1961534.1 type I restriction enzyme HsdR N-terminal domain-containing protein [Flavobacteriaceae bacterium]
MVALNFPPYTFKVKNKENKRLIFDPIRKLFVTLTPEEWVRQHVVQWLLSDKSQSPQLMSIERQITYNNMVKRCDIVVYHPDGSIKLIVECKAPEIKLTQSSFDQIARYNLVLDADFLMVTNGLQHIYCVIDQNLKSYRFLEDLAL